MDIQFLAELFLFFIAMSFFGWLVESIWVAIQLRRPVNRGFLIGPVCPIYGLGAAFIVIVASHAAAFPLAVFAISALGCATLEYFTSFLLEKMFNARWWDYSKIRFNLRGRIRLDYTVIFGLGGLAIVYGLWPAFREFIALLPPQLTLISAGILFIILLTDHIISVRIIKSFKKISRRTPVDDTEDITTYVREVLAEQGRLYRRLNNFNFAVGRPKVRYYHDFTDDFAISPGQSYQLPATFDWLAIRTPAFRNFIARRLAKLYKVCTHTKYRNADILKNVQGGCFIYANHTQTFGDVIRPITYAKNPKILASPANLGIPIIGQHLPSLGALPIPDSIHALRQFEAAVNHYVATGHPIVIYPEAHLWPYYTGIRPLPASAFRFPAGTNYPIFTATTVYRRRLLTKKPRIEIHFAGPFHANPDLSPRAAAKDLRDRIEAAMKKSAKKSNCQYIKYIHKS